MRPLAAVAYSLRRQASHLLAGALALPRRRWRTLRACVVGTRRSKNRAAEERRRSRGARCGRGCRQACRQCASKSRAN